MLLYIETRGVLEPLGSLPGRLVQYYGPYLDHLKCWVGWLLLERIGTGRILRDDHLDPVAGLAKLKYVGDPDDVISVISGEPQA